MKSKTLATLGIGTWILSVASSAEDLSGNYTAPTALIVISAIATLAFTIMAVVRLWKTQKVSAVLFLASSLITLVYISGPIKIINFLLFIWVVSLLWAMAKYERFSKMNMLTKIENYSLNQRVDEAPDLREFDSQEYMMFEAAGMKRMLKDEKIYNGHDINFLGSVWNMVIGATQGEIYKVSIQHMSPDKNESDLLFQKTLEYLEKEMGKHSEHPFLSKKYVWDSADGNVFLHYVYKLGVNSINLFLTSSSIRDQMQNYVSKH